MLTDQGRYAEARAQYGQGLEIARELKDPRGEGVTLGQIGTLALLEGDPAEAERRYQEALALFRRLGEPGMEAVYLHQLGRTFEEAGQWGQAEQHYREAARLKQELGDLAGAAGTWNQLAIVNQFQGKPEAAETWYRKAIDGGRQTGQCAELSNCLSNLADLLRHRPNGLDEARRLAEEALAIKQTLDPGAARIWNTYGILAQIADRQSRADEAARYRRQARDAKRAFAGTAQELRRFAPVITAIAGAVAGQAEARTAVDQLLAKYTAADGENAAFAAAVQRILDGERDVEALCAGLGQSAPVIETILEALADPSRLAELLPDDG